MKITLVLHNIRSTYNVGAVLRTAEGFGVTEVILSGYTPWYRKPGVLPHLAEKLEKQITKTAVGADKMAPTRWVEDILAELDAKKIGGAVLAGLENNVADERVLGLSRAQAVVRDATEVVLVLGEEVDGIAEELLKKLDVLFEIPMRGQKESFNVSVAAGIALYELVK